LYNESLVDSAEKFKRYCRISELSDSIVLDCRGKPSYNIEAASHGFFTDKRLYKLRVEFEKMEWLVAFQLESLLHNCLLHTGELEALLPRVKKLLDEKFPEYVASLLRKYGEQLQTRHPSENAIKCFERILSQFLYFSLSLSPGNFFCSHVTFAPTRLILEGPYAVQSNRVIREYKGYEVCVRFCLQK